MNTEHYKEILLKEKDRLEKELSTVAYKQENGQWEAVSTAVDESTDADMNEVADKIEDYENNHAIVTSLNKELDEVVTALDKINQRTYGICEIDPEHHIESDRLSANPSSRTCKQHMNS